MKKALRETQTLRALAVRPPVVTHPQTGPITIHCAAASAQCNQNGTRSVERVSARAADATKRLLLNERRVNHTQCCGVWL